MAAPRLLRLALLTALVLALAAPAASAHTAVFSTDEKVRGSVGLLNEPVSTYAVTGLDLCFSQDTAAPRKPVNVTDPEAFTVTLRSPSGKTRSAPLEVPFGRANCLTFETPLVLTEPGQYLLDFTGTINGTAFDLKDVKAGGEVIAREQITFPATVASDEALEARIAALEAKGEKGIPAPAAALTFALLAVLATVRRLR
jgi:methionine-rich copper-binding protein CopC